MDEKRLTELEQLAAGADHLELLLADAEHVFLSAMYDPEKVIAAKIARGDYSLPVTSRQTDWNLNPNTVGLLTAARTAVPELVAEVRRLQGMCFSIVVDARMPEGTAAMLSSGQVINIHNIHSEDLADARRAERKRCLELVRGLAPDCDAIAAAIGDYPD